MARRRRLARRISSVLVLGLALAAPSASSSAREGSSDEVAERFLRTAADSFSALGAVSAEDAADGSYEKTVPVGDLDGDARPDLVELRAVPRADFDPDLSLRQSRGYTVTLRGLRGVDGTQLWTYIEKAAALGFVPAAVASGNGIMVASYEVNYSNLSAAYPYVYTLRITAIGGDGVVAWTQPIAGPLANVNFVGSAGVVLPVFRGAMQAAGDGNDDALVETFHYVRNGRTDNKPVAIDATVLDGATGRPTSTASRVVRDADYYFTPFVIPAGDLDADGLEDILFVLQRGAAQPDPALAIAAELSAVSGSDGTEIWSTKAIDFASIAIVRVGDANGDGSEDLAVSNYAPAGEPGTFLLSGADGAVLWSREGRDPIAIGDASGDGRPDIGVLRYIAEEHHIRIEIDALTADGTVVFGTGQRLEGTTGANGLEGSVTPVGDIDADGANDLAVHLGAGFPEAPRRTSDVLLSGSTGSALRGLDREEALGGTVTGQGADLLRLSSRSTGIEVTTIHGRSGQPVWSAVVADGNALDSTTIDVADLDGDGLHEVVVNAFHGGGTTLAVLRGSTGASLW